ncbi:MAG: type II toxin-antitoxin system RelE/ParE family toxin [Flavobacteriaceae bacterium]|nr:type II toxin-antitoxin system RelE/ParE family toxin [Flavobacteriaceae bacterium]
MAVIWSKKSVANLKKIWNFYTFNLNTIYGANNIVKGIKKTGAALNPNFLHQSEAYLATNQYRAIYKHFKIVYTVRNNDIHILQIFDSRQLPLKIK